MNAHTGMHFIDVGPARVAYEVDGQGPGLVLVHGTGCDSQTNWAPLVPLLTPHWTVVRPNYAGSGPTVDPTDPLTVAALARQVVMAARAAGVVPYDLVGFSLGAAVAAHIAAEYPDDVRSIVLLAGFSHGQDSRLALTFRLWQALIHTDRAALTRVFMLTGFSPAFLSTLTTPQIEELVALGVANNQWDGMARQLALDLTLDVRPQAARIRQPAWVVGCTHDHMVDAAHARALADMIPGAHYLTLDSGHLAPLECPQAVADLLRHCLLPDR